MNRKHVKLTASAAGAAGILGLTTLSLPAGAGADPALPPVSPEKLVESVMTSAPPAFSGTVQVDNNLGLPKMPGQGGQSEFLSGGSSNLRVWSDGQGHQRAALPSKNGETTIVNDGSTVSKWDSAQRTVTQTPKPTEKDHTPTDPAGAARHIVDTLRQSSDVKVDGTANVAGRDAYELVLTPKPTEHTMLREVRIAVDAQTRNPLDLAVNTNGTDSPALKVGFSELDMSRPDPGLFKFTPPAGAKVEQPKHDPHGQDPAHAKPKLVGDGWDTVMVSRLPQQPAGQQGQHPDPRKLAEQTGKKVSGPWGQGWIIGTKAGSALVTSDGRLAAGAVPEQVLTSAIGNA